VPALSYALSEMLFQKSAPRQKELHRVTPPGHTDDMAKDEPLNVQVNNVSFGPLAAKIPRRWDDQGVKPGVV
jgi:hypothetical protein